MNQEGGGNPEKSYGDWFAEVYRSISEELTLHATELYDLYGGQVCSHTSVGSDSSLQEDSGQKSIVCEILRKNFPTHGIADLIVIEFRNRYNIQLNNNLEISQFICSFLQASRVESDPVRSMFDHLNYDNQVKLLNLVSEYVTRFGKELNKEISIQTERLTRDLYPNIVANIVQSFSSTLCYITCEIEDGSR